jgi:hypothetical protein
MSRALVIGLEGSILLILGVANSLSGRPLAALILFGLGVLALACSWTLWPLRT